ncbi:MAG: hypothetical protein JJU40_08950 [Rhodobacteraceae bacterium]|nr:hypothetical protein [Paracoccaceae bacterium]
MMLVRGWILGPMVGAGLVFGAATGAAQEAIGEIVATIDGEPRAWRTLGPDGSGTDYNTFLEVFGPMQGVSLMGFPPGRVTIRGTVQLTFTLMGDALDLFEQEVIYAPEGMSRMWVSLEGEDLITVEHFEASGSEAEVSGRVAGRVCLKEGLFSEPDPERCKSIEGTFGSRVPAAAD